MIFNNKKKAQVGYYYENTIDIPNTMYSSIDKINTNEVNCPAVATLNNRLFGVKPIVSIDIEFGIKNNEVFYVYKIDETNFTTSEEVHKLIKNTLIVQQHNNCASLQILSYATFFTDERNLEIMSMPNHNVELTNCKFISGAFYLKNWSRNINASFIQLEKDKPAKLSIKYNEPMFNIIFNNPVNLQLIKPKEKTIEYIHGIKNITQYYKNVINKMTNIINKRPRKLL